MSSACTLFDHCHYQCWLPFSCGSCIPASVPSCSNHCPPAFQPTYLPACLLCPPLSTVLPCSRHRQWRQAARDRRRRRLFRQHLLSSTSRRPHLTAEPGSRRRQQLHQRAAHGGRRPVLPAPERRSFDGRRRQRDVSCCCYCCISCGVLHCCWRVCSRWWRWRGWDGPADYICAGEPLGVGGYPAGALLGTCCVPLPAQPACGAGEWEGLPGWGGGGRAQMVVQWQAPCSSRLHPPCAPASSLCVCAVICI